MRVVVFRTIGGKNIKDDYHDVHHFDFDYNPAYDYSVLTLYLDRGSHYITDMIILATNTPFSVYPE